MENSSRLHNPERARPSHPSGLISSVHPELSLPVRRNFPVPRSLGEGGSEDARKNTFLCKTNPIFPVSIPKTTIMAKNKPNSNPKQTQKSAHKVPTKINDSQNLQPVDTMNSTHPKHSALKRLDTIVSSLAEATDLKMNSKNINLASDQPKLPRLRRKELYTTLTNIYIGPELCKNFFRKFLIFSIFFPTRLIRSPFARFAAEKYLSISCKSAYTAVKCPQK